MDTYTVYKHTAPNGKVYIGQTKKSLECRWKNGKGYTCHQHGFFWKAIQKYGWDNFTHEVLADDLTQQNADYYEKYFIALYRSTDKRYGYNCTSGGSSGYRYTDTAKGNISEGLKEHYRKNGKPKSTSYAREVLRRKQSRKIAQYDLNGNLLHIYDSAMSAEETTGISHKRINACVCTVRNIAACGYMWTYGENAPSKIKPYKRNREIWLLDKNGNFIEKYESAQEAAEKIGCSKNTVFGCLNNRFSYSKSLGDKRLIYVAKGNERLA